MNHCIFSKLRLYNLPKDSDQPMYWACKGKLLETTCMIPEIAIHYSGSRNIKCIQMSNDLKVTESLILTFFEIDAFSAQDKRLS